MANSRARSVNDTEGLVKFISEKKTDRILGAHIMGPNAGKLNRDLYNQPFPQVYVSPTLLVAIFR